MVCKLGWFSIAFANSFDEILDDFMTNSSALRHADGCEVSTSFAGVSI
jgi:hypothetical protein